MTKRMNTNIQVNLPVDNKRDSGMIGKHVHAEIGKVIPLNGGRGPDIDGLGIEIKTRQTHSKADQTQCSMSRKAIIETPYADSPFRDKMQKQLRVKVNSAIGVKAEERIYDMTDDDIQKPLEEDYEHCRRAITNGAQDVRSAPNGLVTVEKIKKRKDRFKIRITDKGMKTIENRSLRDKTAWDSMFG